MLNSHIVGSTTSFRVSIYRRFQSIPCDIRTLLCCSRPEFR